MQRKPQSEELKSCTVELENDNRQFVKVNLWQERTAFMDNISMCEIILYIPAYNKYVI